MALGYLSSPSVREMQRHVASLKPSSLNGSQAEDGLAKSEMPASKCATCGEPCLTEQDCLETQKRNRPLVKRMDYNICNGPCRNSCDDIDWDAYTKEPTTEDHKAEILRDMMHGQATISNG